MAVSASLPVQAQVTFTEYPVPTASSQPYAITAGPDGALWFTEETSGKIGRISTSGVITEYAPTAAQGALNEPQAITTGPDGALWIAAVGTIARLTTSGVFSLYPVASPNSNIHSIIPGPDGALWFTSSVPNIGRITTSGAITFFPLTNQGASPGNIIVGPDKAFWIGDPNTDHIDRMTTSGAVTQYTPPAGSSGPADITIGPDGAMWAISGPNIASFTTAGVYTSTYPLNSLSAQSLVSGPDGNLWFIFWEANQIIQVTLSGTFTKFTLPTGSSEPWSTIAGPDGAMWITERSANKIARMTVPAATPTGPTILAGGIVNAASYASANGVGSPVAPGALVAIFTSTLSATAANFNTATLPGMLGGVSVTFNNVPAPMVAVSPTGQYPYVSVQVPFEVSGTVPVVITVNGTPSPAVQESIVPSQPGIFTIPATGQGNAILTFLDPATNQPAIAAPASSGITYRTAAIPRGTGGFFYVTGLGAMTPAVSDGSGTCPAANGLCNANALPTVLVGGMSAPVAFAGQAPGFPGVFQVNITIPQSAPTGSAVPLVVKSADGSVTSNTATIAVQ